MCCSRDLRFRIEALDCLASSATFSMDGRGKVTTEDAENAAILPLKPYKQHICLPVLSEDYDAAIAVNSRYRLEKSMFFFCCLLLRNGRKGRLRQLSTRIGGNNSIVILMKSGLSDVLFSGPIVSD